MADLKDFDGLSSLHELIALTEFDFGHLVGLPSTLAPRLLDLPVILLVKLSTTFLSDPTMLSLETTEDGLERGLVGFEGVVTAVDDVECFSAPW